MLERESLPVPVSALQHYLFCPRQCALIHVERVWTENAATAEGRVLHEKVDVGVGETRGCTRTLRGLTLFSNRHGLSGKADVVELHSGTPFPVEYKRGRPKPHRADEVQLCAQALCLEEMFSQSVPHGALVYGQTRRRLDVTFDSELRTLTLSILSQCRAMLDSGQTPPPQPMPACKQCSLADNCQPDALNAPISVRRWLDRAITD